MTLRSRSRRHRSPPTNCFRTKFFLSGCISKRRARTYTKPRRALPTHLLNPRKVLWKQELDAAGFQSADLFFHVAIYFFTAACAGWMRKENAEGEGTPSLTLSPPPPFFPRFFTFLLSFCPPSYRRAPHSIRLRASIEGEWWMVIGGKLCAAVTLMLRNASKLGKFDLRDCMGVVACAISRIASSVFVRWTRTGKKNRKIGIVLHASIHYSNFLPVSATPVESLGLFLWWSCASVENGAWVRASPSSFQASVSEQN